ncbi:MAG TPA: hypothetical protein VLN59_11680, partial [Burkholderiales bacterium]|nr:hypothetical protein [Burkholderiales bacterium]
QAQPILALMDRTNGKVSAEYRATRASLGEWNSCAACFVSTEIHQTMQASIDLTQTVSGLHLPSSGL